MPDPQPIPRAVLRHPRSAYLIAIFGAVCATSIVYSPWLALVYLAPLAGAIYVARTATIVDEAGITARVVFGSVSVGWSELAGLRLDPTGAVYAVDSSGGQVRLPCLRSTRLDALVRAGCGRIPDFGASQLNG